MAIDAVCRDNGKWPTFLRLCITKTNRAAKIAFFAGRHMFNDIAELAEGEKCRMTAYVDDVTISGPAATKKKLGEVRKVVSR
ncbi:RNA-dependent RNA polymerase family protein [Burkholderia semiarida]